MTLSIRWKVALAILFALLCGFIIAGLLAARSLAEQELTQSEGALEVSTNLIAFDLRPLVTGSSSLPTMPRLQTIVRELSHRARARVTLVDASGRVLADSAVRDDDLASVENHRTRPEIEQAIATGAGTDLRASHTTGERTLYRAIRLDGPDRSTTLYLRLGLPMTALDQELATLKRNLTLAFGSAFLIAVALSIWLARSLTKPLSDMAAAARQLAGGNLAMHIETSARDEVGLLAHTLNHMSRHRL